MLTQRKPEACHVASGGLLRRIRQSVRVAERRPAHAEGPCALGHHLRESRFRSAEKFADGGRRVICRLGHQGEDGVLDRNRLTGLQAELRGLLVRRVARDRDRGVERDAPGLQCVEDQVERHHLGQRSRIARLIRARFIQRLAGLCVDDDAGIFRIRMGGVGKRRQHGDRQQSRDEELDRKGRPIGRACKRLTHGYTLLVSCVHGWQARPASFP